MSSAFDGTTRIDHLITLLHAHWLAVDHLITLLDADWLTVDHLPSTYFYLPGFLMRSGNSKAF